MNDPDLLMQAALDGELDAAGQLAFERLLEGDLALTAKYDRLKALRQAIRSQLPRDTAPAKLRRRLEAATVSRPPRGFSRLALAASVALGVLLGGGGMYALMSGRAPGQTLAANHRRALLAGAPFDVALNDRHNLRPWFDARIAVSPPTPDLTKAGYPLEGGRIDILDRAAVPTMVYRIREHVVSVSALPLTDGAPGPADAGYHILSWRGAGFLYAAVSDADEAELARFAKAFQAAESTGSER